MATRESSGKVLNALAKNIPWLLGGSADLAHSNKTNLTFEGAGDFYAINTRAAISILASANTVWAPPSTG